MLKMIAKIGLFYAGYYLGSHIVMDAIFDLEEKGKRGSYLDVYDENGNLVKRVYAKQAKKVR